MLKKELEKENRKLRSELKKEKAQADSFKQAMGRLNVRLADQAQEINVFKKETGKLDKVLAEIKRIALYLSTTQGMKGGYKNLLDNIVSLVSEKNKYKGMASTLQLKLNNWEREACGYLGRIVKDPAKAFLDIYDEMEEKQELEIGALKQEVEDLQVEYFYFSKSANYNFWEINRLEGIIDEMKNKE